MCTSPPTSHSVVWPSRLYSGCLAARHGFILAGCLAVADVFRLHGWPSRFYYGCLAGRHGLIVVGWPSRFYSDCLAARHGFTLAG